MNCKNILNIRKTSRCIMVASLLFCYWAQAIDKVEIENQQLDEKQIILASRLKNIDMVSDVASKYSYVRDQKFYGDQGILKNANTINDKINAWLKGQYELLSFIDLNIDHSDSIIIDDLHKRLNAQNKKYYEILELTQTVFIQVTDSKRILAELTLHEQIIPGYEQHTRLLKKRIEELSAALNIFTQKFNEENARKLEKVLTPTRDMIIATLKKKLLNYPELEKILSMTNEAFRVMLDIDMIVENASVKFEKLQQYYRSNLYFHADKQLKDLNSEIENGVKKIEGLHADTLFTQPAIATLKKWNKIAIELHNGRLSRDKWQLVNTASIMLKKKYAMKCKNERERAKYNCQLLKILLPISAEQLSSMSDEQLKYYEYQFDLIENGPIL
ncbi:MAG: hypothetical protein HQK52_11170 [Oligoflexia bacterium]|nr:hypothetical protein [Oligoflexia bacterium]